MSSASPMTVRNPSFTHQQNQQDQSSISPVQHHNSHDFSPPKRKSTSETAGNNHESQNGTDENGKKKRRKVNHACVYCRRSHMTCDLQRPCARCVKRDIGHLCHDEPRDPPKRGKSEGAAGPAEIAPAPDGSGGDGVFAAAGGADSMEGQGPTLVQPTPISPKQLRAQPAATLAPSGNMTGMGNLGNLNFDWNNSNMQNQFQDMHHLHPNYMFNTSEVTNEYNMLNDFLTNSLNDDGQLFNNTDGNGISGDAANVFLSDPLLTTSSMNALQQNQQQPPNTSYPQQNPQQRQNHLPPPPPIPNPSKLAEEISRPSSAFPISEATRNKFYMTAADPAGLSTGEDRLHKILKGKYDAGMLKPFNYVKGYARLNNYMSAHLSRESQVRILKQLERFRPQFRSAMQSLTDMQLVLVEMWFERSLMEYDRVFASMAIPACCWRRTGEIFRGNREFAELVGVGWERLRDGRLAIHEVLGEESLVSYWEKFGAIAFDGTQKAILTSCSLRRLDGGGGDEGSGGAGGGKGGGGAGGGGKREEKGLQKCCFSFTIRRDTHNIPSLIVGNFIPIRGDGARR